MERIVILEGRQKESYPAWMLTRNAGYSKMTENDPTGLERAKGLLKEKLLRWMPEPERYPTAVEGLTIVRRHEVNQHENCFHKPLVGVIVQGFKRSIIGSFEIYPRLTLPSGPRRR